MCKYLLFSPKLSSFSKHWEHQYKLMPCYRQKRGWRGWGEHRDLKTRCAQGDLPSCWLLRGAGTGQTHTWHSSNSQGSHLMQRLRIFSRYKNLFLWYLQVLCSPATAGISKWNCSDSFTDAWSRIPHPSVLVLWCYGNNHAGPSWAGQEWLRWTIAVYLAPPCRWQWIRFSSPGSCAFSTHYNLVTSKPPKCSSPLAQARRSSSHSGTPTLRPDSIWTELTTSDPGGAQMATVEANSEGHDECALTDSVIALLFKKEL